MDIYIANVPYEYTDGEKIRSALVVKITAQKIGVFKITSQYVQFSYFKKKFYYKIMDWKGAGLNKQSYVDTHKIFRLPPSKVFKNKPIGKLTYSDVIRLFEFIKQS